MSDLFQKLSSTVYVFNTLILLRSVVRKSLNKIRSRVVVVVRNSCQYRNLKLRGHSLYMFRGQPQQEATTRLCNRIERRCYAVTLCYKGQDCYVVSVALPPRDCRSTKRCFGTSSRGRGLFGVVDADGFGVRSRRFYQLGSFNAGSHKILFFVSIVWQFPNFQYSLYILYRGIL